MTELFKCPLCGRRRPVSDWDPTHLDDEVIVQEVQGAGRGQGFVTVDEHDATLDYDSSVDLLAMARRCLKIVEVCMRSPQVSASDLVDDVSLDLEEEVVTEKAGDFGYEKKASEI